MSRRTRASASVVVGRILLSVIFLWSGWHKLTAPGAVVPFMQSHHIPWSGMLVYIAGSTEFVGALALITGWRARAAAWMLLFFLIPTTLIFHTTLVVPFADAAQAQMNFLHVLTNLAIMGGLLIAGTSRA